MRKTVKLIMELIFIFIIPLVILCINCNYENTIEYDNNGNYQSTEKHIVFNTPFTYYVNDKEYLNILHLNQLAKIVNTKVDNGVTFTNNDNGTYTINGTASNIASATLEISDNIVLNHYYYYNLNGATNSVLEILGYTNTRKNVPTIILNNYTTNPFAIRVPATETANNEIVTPIIIDLTVMFGSGYEPSTILELSNYIDLDSYIPYTEDQIIYYESDNIVSSVYKNNFTVWGNLKNIIINSLQLQDNQIVDIIVTYTILWFIMFLLWHLFYGLFDGLIHMLSFDRKRE